MSALLVSDPVADRERVSGLLVQALVATPGSRVRQLAGELGIEKAQLNSVLYQRRDLFEAVGPQPPAWYLRAGISTRPAFRAAATTDSAKTNRFELYPWQADALAAWEANGHRGIAEAVTGAGKTRVGMSAIGSQLDRGGRVAVLVPGIELLNQWHAELSDRFAHARIGMMGAGHSDTLEHNDILIATAASARRYELGLPEGMSGLLVADECHRYGAEVTQLALEPVFERRLGLSATYERSDGAHETILLPYFERVVFTLGYERAIRDGVVAHVRLALLGVSFSRQEREEYEALSEQVSKARTRLIVGLGVPGEPFAEFISEVNRLATHGTREQGIAAKKFLKHWQARRALMAGSPAKLAALDRLAPAMLAADRSLVFTRTTASADELAMRLRAQGVPSGTHHSKIPQDERAATLQAFRVGQLKTLTTALTLNEGIDVPEADLAVIMAASAQHLEMVQRMGRVMRLKPDRRDARFVLVYIRDTPEDPALGAHESFLDELLHVAEDARTFGERATPRELAAYLAP